MNPLLLPLLLSFGPAGLSALLGIGKDPQRDIRQQILQLLSPASQAKLTGQFFNSAVSSPAYSQAQGTIAAGANQASNNVAANLAERGIGTTGTGAVLSGLTPSLVGSQVAKLKTSAHELAQKQTDDYLQNAISALMKTSGPSQTRQLLGGGLDSFSPFLQSYLKAKFPHTFAPITGATVS